MTASGTPQRGRDPGRLRRFRGGAAVQVTALPPQPEGPATDPIDGQAGRPLARRPRVGRRHVPRSLSVCRPGAVAAQSAAMACRRRVVRLARGAARLRLDPPLCRRRRRGGGAPRAGSGRLVAYLLHRLGSADLAPGSAGPAIDLLDRSEPLSAGRRGADVPFGRVAEHGAPGPSSGPGDRVRRSRATALDRRHRPGDERSLPARGRQTI